jgi:hypothetical protein
MLGFSVAKILAVIETAASAPATCLPRRGSRLASLARIAFGRVRPAAVMPLSISQGVVPPEALERWRAAVRKGGIRGE